jgi:hypothetical protein
MVMLLLISAAELFAWSLGVNSLGAHNHALCWSLIPKSAEGEVVWDAVMKLLEEWWTAALDKGVLTSKLSLCPANTFSKS